MTAKKTTLRHCIGSARFGIEPHDAPVVEFPRQPSQRDGLGRMCGPHWKAYVKGLSAERKARAASGRTVPPEARPGTTMRERRETPMASKPVPNAESPRVRKARELLAATEKLGGPTYLEAFGSDEVQAALETVNGHREPDAEQADAVEAIALESDPRAGDESRALEDDAA